jgi:hypothetical protein
MKNCLRGCIGKYNRKGVIMPVNTEVVMPWVEVSIIGGQKKISVSNYSSRRSLAVIKTFQFGSVERARSFHRGGGRRGREFR